MDYQEFRMSLKGILQKNAEEKEVIFRWIPKNNGVQREAVLISEPGAKIVPTIYVDDLYEQYLSGDALQEIAEALLEVDDINENILHLEYGFMDSFEKVKRKLYFKIVNYRMNEQMLKNMPHIRYLDLAIVFYYRLEEKEFQGASMLIHNSSLELWKVDREQLLKTAMENTSRKLPPVLRGMKQMIKDLMEQSSAEGGIEVSPRGYLPEKDRMYILTNEEKYFGAATILYPHLLGHIAKIFQKSFYILPSSIHECILVPDSGQFSKEDLSDMVKDVNRNHVIWEEVLSDHVYYYDMATGGVKM